MTDYEPQSSLPLSIPYSDNFKLYEEEDDFYDSSDQKEFDDYTNLKLKPDHHRRPIYITPCGRIFLETFSNVIKEAQEFLVSIAEPECRPEFIHEFKLTPYSLYAAASVGLETKDIIYYLDLLCKTNVPEGVENFIEHATAQTGKLKLVVKYNTYHIESNYPKLIEQVFSKDGVLRSFIDRDFVVPGAEQLLESVTSLGSDYKKPQVLDLLDQLTDAQDGDIKQKKEIKSYALIKDKVGQAQQRFQIQGIPLLAEYDFRNDNQVKDLPIHLRANAILRPYQEKALRKMFGNGRARSGLIVLPCGAGKTLTGITAATTIRKSCIILCTSAVAVEQWAAQFRLWTTATDEMIIKLVSNGKDKPDHKTKIMISTYSMVGFDQKRSKEAEMVMKWVTEREWGLMILDEVHTIPADKFRKVLTKVACHCKLGLTATLVREDEKINDLYYLVGPKLYEANWLELQKHGYIARVQCAEVWCPMTPEFYREYLRVPSCKKPLLYAMNPNKVRRCHYLIKYHESRGDKIIVFGDEKIVLRLYAVAIGRYLIYGETKQNERIMIINNFKKGMPKFQTIFISRVGDNSFDMPDANVLIQISSHGGSRRQEAQRLGRILRAKKNSAAAMAVTGNDYYNAYFYSLVSTDTKEVAFSIKRQRFLVNQGYSFKVVTDLPGIDNDKDLYLTKKDDQKLMLAKLLEEEKADIENSDDEEILGIYGKRKKKVGPVSKRPKYQVKNALFKKFR